MPDASKQIKREDMQHLLYHELTALRDRAYANWMKREVCNTSALSGKYRTGLRWMDIYHWCSIEMEHRATRHAAE